MLGAIAGDIIGSVYERSPIKTEEFPLFSAGSVFTDDTVLTVACADGILTGREFSNTLREYYFRYPNAGYGARFIRWANSEDPQPYNSWGNGSAMRVSPIGYAFDSLDQILEESKKSAEVTHNHPEGIKGAQAVAAAIFLARTGTSKEDILLFIENRFQYSFSRSLDEIRPFYSFKSSCQDSVPEALQAFFESVDFESAVRKAVSLGGDSDTQACIAGAVAEAYYEGVPSWIEQNCRKILPEELKGTIDNFAKKYIQTR